MVYRNKTYVCFDGDNDMHYYRIIAVNKAGEGEPSNTVMAVL